MYRWLIILPALLLLSGCGNKQSGPQRVVVEGAATYQGKPIERGDILFTPVVGSSNPASGAIIENGKFRADNKGGVPVGKFSVKITGVRVTNPGQVGDIEEVMQYIPAKYNERTTLEIEIPADEPQMQHDFTLE
ncbi:MAG: hypothetical protein ACIALR_12730 [Blastopirellula sp. JB062]